MACWSTPMPSGPTFAVISAGSTEQTAGQWMTFTVPSGTFTMTRRKLRRTSCCTRFVTSRRSRYAARLAGHEPPGEHDFFYSPGD